MRGKPICRRDPCGCVFRSHDIEYCPKHKPAWQAAVEAVIRGQLPDVLLAPPLEKEELR